MDYTSIHPHHHSSPQPDLQEPGNTPSKDGQIGRSPSPCPAVRKDKSDSLIHAGSSAYASNRKWQRSADDQEDKHWVGRNEGRTHSDA